MQLNHLITPERKVNVSPKHKMMTLAWCSVTMAGTMVLSHGHLIMKEILRNWPVEDTWEGRFENALYTQGGLALLASMILSLAIVVRGWMARKKDEELARRERLQLEKHQRAEAERHTAMLSAIETLGKERVAGNGSGQGTSVKKSYASGAKPR